VIRTFEFRHLDAQALPHPKVPCFPRDFFFGTEKPRSNARDRPLTRLPSGAWRRDEDRTPLGRT
jgi:hypothetical protein